MDENLMLVEELQCNGYKKLSYYNKFLVIDNKEEVNYLNSQGFYWDSVKFGYANKRDKKGVTTIWIYLKFIVLKNELNDDYEIVYIGDKLEECHKKYQLDKNN